jgi:hypothetical protein
MKTFKLLASETILEDSYPIIPDYVYICDGRFMRYPGWSEITVAEWKHAGNWKEVRRCDLSGHEGARLGDRVTGKAES